MIFSSIDKNNIMFKRYDEASKSTEFVFSRKKYLNLVDDEVVFRIFYNELQNVCIVASEKKGKCIDTNTIMLRKNKVFMETYELLKYVYNYYNFVESKVSLKNNRSLKWLLRFARNNKYKVEYEYERNLLKIIKEEYNGK